jgi:hypothetical protein
MTIPDPTAFEQLLSAAAYAGVKEKVLTEEEILQAREEEISAGLMRFQGRTRWEPTSEETPAHELSRKEGMPLNELLEAQDGELAEWATRLETIRAFFRYITFEGIDPVEVLRRLYAVGSHMGIPPFDQLTTRDKARIFGDSHEGHRWLIKELCIKPLQRLGAKSIKAPGQKGRAASVAAHHAQKGNDNRAADHVRPNGENNRATKEANRGNVHAAARKISTTNKPKPKRPCRRLPKPKPINKPSPPQKTRGRMLPPKCAQAGRSRRS